VLFPWFGDLGCSCGLIWGYFGCLCYVFVLGFDGYVFNLVLLVVILCVLVVIWYGSMDLGEIIR
jgi:hypothetical protein